MVEIDLYEKLNDHLNLEFYTLVINFLDGYYEIDLQNNRN